MKRKLSFDEAMYSLVCPDCGAEVEWWDTPYEHTWRFKCCREWKMSIDKVKVEMKED